MGIKDAPTHFGVVSYRFSLDPAKSRLIGTIDFPASKAPYNATLHCRLPIGLRVIKVNKASEAMIVASGAALEWSHPQGVVHFEAEVASGN